MHICVVASQSKSPQVADEHPSKVIFPLGFPKFVCWLVRDKHGNLKPFRKREGPACVQFAVNFVPSKSDQRIGICTVAKDTSCFRMHPSDGKMQMGLSQEPCNFQIKDRSGNNMRAPDGIPCKAQKLTC